MQARSTSGSLRLAAVGDIHCSRHSRGALKSLFVEMAEAADVIVLCGDLTDYGTPEEAHVLAEESQAAERVPIIAVLGNHDYESGKQEEVTRALADAGYHVLDGDGIEVHGVGFAGAKGHVGGFGARALQAWGEASIKGLVHEAAEEAIKLDRGLSRLRTDKRIAVLHYSPIEATVAGEPREILPFLGSSRLEEPLNRHPVTAVLHGHAHGGSPEGRTTGGAPVYNVAMSLMEKTSGRRFRVLDIPQ